jgi:hypothetical protein
MKNTRLIFNIDCLLIILWVIEVVFLFRSENFIVIAYNIIFLLCLSVISFVLGIWGIKMTQGITLITDINELRLYKKLYYISLLLILVTIITFFIKFNGIN